MNISSVDLNLLAVFDALCIEKNTVRAARRLSMSQPAVSHALARLRLVFQDRLFVRSSRGLIPTPRSLELQPRVRQIVENAEQVFFAAPEFHAKTARRTFRMATTDLFEQLALPIVLEKLSQQAPGVTLISRPTLGRLPKDELEDGSLDFAVAGFYNEVPERFFQQKLYQEDFVCVARKGVIAGSSEVSLKQYAGFRHLLISPQGDLQSFSRAYFKKKGIDLMYAAGVASFLSPARILSKSDLVLTCPRRLAQSYCENFDFKIYELPFKIPTIQMIQVWHEQRQDDLGHQWMRKLVREVCRTI